MIDSFLLINGYLDGSLTDDQGGELNAWVEADDANAREFVRLCLQHHLIRSQMIGQDVQVMGSAESSVDDDGALSPPSILLEALDQEREAKAKREAVKALEREKHEAKLAEDRALQRIMFGQSDPVKPIKHYVIPKSVFYGAIAAVVALTAMLLWPQGRLTPPTEPGDLRVEPSAPPIVAVLNQLLDAQWEDASFNKAKPGDPLHAGRFALKSGSVLITLNEGTEVIVEGPALFEIVSGRRMNLHTGRVSSYSPHRARGFAIRTPGAEIIDLGTRFGVEVHNDQMTEVHVFEGLVTAATVNNRDEVAAPVKLYADESAKCNANTGVVELSNLVDAGRFVRSWREMLTKVKVQGDVRYRPNAPGLLEIGATTSNEHILVIPEAYDAVIDQDMPLAMTSPGTYSSPIPSPNHILYAGRVVDSYLLHANISENSRSERRRFSGAVRFPRKVIGLIIDAHSLDASDDSCGLAKVVYPWGEPSRGIGYGEKRETREPSNEEFTLSDDRKTLQFAFRVGLLDQVRVLIEPAGGNTLPSYDLND